MAAKNNPLEHRARKRFGQNFLRDQGIIDRIVRSINAKNTDNIVEIGPGQGAITAPLLQACPRLNVIEIDRDLIPVLLAQFAKYPDFNIHQQDVLNFDFNQLINDEPLRVIGNLPYNISTPLIFHLLSYAKHIGDMHFMLQKEVVQRLAADVGDKHYGRLSIMVQYYCEVEHLFAVPPECFTPQPKVDSAIVRLIPHRAIPCVAKDLPTFSGLVNTAFGQRRKTLRNSLKNLLSGEQIASLKNDLGVDPTLRPEKISLEQFVSLSNRIYDTSTN